MENIDGQKLKLSGISEVQATNVIAYLGNLEYLKKFGKTKCMEFLPKIPMVSKITADKIVYFIF